jgi:hypothetical protein
LDSLQVDQLLNNYLVDKCIDQEFPEDQVATINMDMLKIRCGQPDKLVRLYRSKEYNMDIMFNNNRHTCLKQPYIHLNYTLQEPHKCTPWDTMYLVELAVMEMSRDRYIKVLVDNSTSNNNSSSSSKAMRLLLNLVFQGGLKHLLMDNQVSKTGNRVSRKYLRRL